MLYKKCQICQSTFYKPYKLSKRQWESSKYCSRKCSGKNVSQKIKGRIPWNYKGTTPLDKLERVKFQKQIQKLVFERDNYTCQICGLRGVDLQVDHIQSWKDYVELRFDIKNCRTLCAKCHYKITFGKPMPENITGWGHHKLKGDKYCEC